MANQIVVELVASVDKATKSIDSFKSSTEKNLGLLRLSAANFIGEFASNIATKGLELIADGLQEVGAFLKESIDLAAKHEQALNQMNTALSLAGKYSRETSEGLKEYAEQIQRTTSFDDDLVLKNLALLESLTRLDEQGLKRAQTAALNLAAALQIDLTTATEMVARAAEGNITAFQRHGIEILKADSNAQTFANTLKVLEDRFGGSAAAQVQTFAGAQTQLGNAFEDLHKSVGAIITDNPVVLEGMGLLKGAFEELSGWVQQNKEFLMGLVSDGISLIIQSIPYVVDGFTALMNIGDVLFSALKAGFEVAVMGVNYLILGVGKLMEALGLGGEEIQGFAQQQIDASNAALDADVTTLNQRIEARQEFRDKTSAMSDEEVDKIQQIIDANDESTDRFIKNKGQEVQAQEKSWSQMNEADKRGLNLFQQMRAQMIQKYKDGEVDKVAAFQTSLGTISTLQQSSNLELFRIGQAAAIANAVINTAQGVSLAFGTVPYPYDFVVAALVGAAGAAQIAKIASQKPPSSAADGIDFIPEDKMTWIASRGERVVGSRLNEDLTSFLQNQKDNGQGPGAVYNMTFNVSGVIGEFDDRSRIALTNEVVRALEFQNISRRGVI
jgi:hypothetical protein